MAPETKSLLRELVITVGLGKVLLLLSELAQAHIETIMETSKDKALAARLYSTANELRALSRLIDGV